MIVVPTRFPDVKLIRLRRHEDEQSVAPAEAALRAAEIRMVAA
jgi:hypothetical protein